MKIFDLDGPLYKIGNELADFMLLSIMFVVGCIPIVTIGTSASALFYVYGKKIRKEDPYIYRDFVKSYKQNFKQSLPITIILLIVWASAVLYFISLLSPTFEGFAFMLYSGFVLFFCIEVILFSTYTFAILSRFHMSIKNTFVLSFVLTNKHLITSFLLLCMTIISAIVILVVPPMLLMIPGIMCYASSHLIQPIFAKTIGTSEENVEEEVEETMLDKRKREINEIYEEKAIYSLKDIQALNQKESTDNAAETMAPKIVADAE
ncbi:YesL family protein [Candidatus Epulonipiscium viviparus]|uniref:YesL family protein n=1 Tax=Candidatus Epulonipiscium viviparus TaxID=420336 RepID=UPI0027380C7F|nr:YesL family protein [Candidatus Epulopiscium viviparus]